MHISIVIILSLLTVFTSAVPSRRSNNEVKVQIVNNRTGRSVSKTIPLDNQKRDVAQLFGTGPLISDGKFLASSVQLTRLARGGLCQITDKNDQIIAEIDECNTYDDLDGDHQIANPIDMKGSVIVCGKE
ncbi:predicted protein [Histoplasma capsulatum G186AR]|uniref:Uncharacterized protein n=1 Tax=Ajellomyces capsulatus (strain G186AR / H82 / ATCC MYA-2454 / RMSCC 2432) TaxID=447093 RepID=C0NJD0_AJECG|nr:uncharacterized protein HCBG_03260 [Histoplasma capsulatum G186AR]EEH07971.1 predicted protein [Histoplasma capsulatum G186AR]